MKMLELCDSINLVAPLVFYIVVALVVKGYIYLNTVQTSNPSGGFGFSSETAFLVYDKRRKFVRILITCSEIWHFSGLCCESG